MEYKVNDFGTISINFSDKEIKMAEEIKSKVNDLGNDEVPPIGFMFAKYIGNEPAIKCGENKFLFRENKISAKLTVASLAVMPNRFQLLAGAYFAEAVNHGTSNYDEYLEPIRLLKKADKKRVWFNGKYSNIYWGKFNAAASRFKVNFDNEHIWRNSLSVSDEEFCRMLFDELELANGSITDEEANIFLQKFYPVMIKKDNVVYYLNERDLEIALRVFNNNNIKFRKIEKLDHYYIMIL